MVTLPPSSVSLVLTLSGHPPKSILASFGGHQAGPLKGPDLVLQGTSQRSLVVACRLHDFLGATSPISGRAGPRSLSAALPPTLSCVEEPMMIQPESLGLPPSNGNDIEAKRNEASILRHFLYRSKTKKLIPKL